MPYYKNFTMATVTLTDGTGTPLVYTADVDDGTLSISDVVPGLRESSDYSRKGAYVSSAYTDRKYPTVTLTVNMDVWKGGAGAGDGSFSDMVLGTAGTEFAARTSTILPAGGVSGKVPLALDIGITIEGTDFGDSADHAGVLTDARFDGWNFSEGDPNKIATNWIVLGAITGDFAATEA